MDETKKTDLIQNTTKRSIPSVYIHLYFRPHRPWERGSSGQNSCDWRSRTRLKFVPEEKIQEKDKYTVDPKYLNMLKG